MRKIGAVSFAAFYLLLTTGVYVCLLHCTAERFLGTSVVMVDNDDDHDENHEITALLTQGHQNASAHHHEKKPCKGGDCDCCNKHGSYAIKENINVSTDFSLMAITVLVSVPNYYPDQLLTGFQIEADNWPYPNGPPLFYQLPHYIFNRSLLI
jgi:hypothetical protein